MTYLKKLVTSSILQKRIGSLCLSQGYQCLLYGTSFLATLHITMNAFWFIFLIIGNQWVFVALSI